MRERWTSVRWISALFFGASILALSACGQQSARLSDAPPSPPPPPIVEPTTTTPAPTPAPPPPTATPTLPVPDPPIEEAPPQAVACGGFEGDVCTANDDNVMDFSCVFGASFPNLSERWHRVGIDLTDTISFRLNTGTIGDESRNGRAWLLPDPNCFGSGPTAPMVIMSISTQPNDFDSPPDACKAGPDWNALINWAVEGTRSSDCQLDDNSIYYINVGVMNCPGGRCTQTLVISEG